MDDGNGSDDEGGYDIGPDEVYSRYRNEFAPGERRLVNMVSGVRDGPNGMEVEYEQVYVTSWSGPQAQNQSTEGNSSFYSEANRLATFTNNWSRSYFVTIEDLARNGLYYIGPQDKVKCAFCLKTLRGWEENDSVEGEHRRLYPNCPFVRGECIDRNIPISLPADMERNMRIHFREQASHPEHSLINERLQTFNGWRYSAIVTPQSLASAGFYYTGPEDRVRCFFCNVLVHSWEEGDDPLEEHVKLKPSCSFAKEEKSRRDQRSRQERHVPESMPGSATPRTLVTNGHNRQMGATQCTEPSVNIHPVLERDLKSAAAQAVLEMNEMTVEQLRLVLQRLRLTKDPSEKITAEEIINHYESMDKQSSSR